MSDFLIVFSRSGHEEDSSVIKSLRYYDDMRVERFEFENFKMILSRSDDWGVWGPYASKSEELFVALSGRIALDDCLWQEARRLTGDGGLACKAISLLYQAKEIEALKNLNGNFVVMIFNGKTKKFHIITDRCGMVPCFVGKRQNKELAFSSHPDVLAEFLGTSLDWDTTSMGEFLITGRVSFPYSYYQSIQALDCGCIHTISTDNEAVNRESKEKYFEFKFKIDPKVTEYDLAEELAAAFRKAVNRRVNPLIGHSAISLSGGIDARALLCSVGNKENVSAFTFFDEPNYEYQIAEAIAKTAEVKFFPLKRDFDYYGNTAEMAAKISGGFGSISENHYLGFRERLRNLGIKSVISGLYCDYLFKGLHLDKKKNRYARTEVLSDFRYESYEPYFLLNTMLWSKVRERLDYAFSDKMKEDKSNIGRLAVEAKRIFPLCYELENLVPQRALPWYPPTIDNEIIDVYLKIPPMYKLNVSVFSKVAMILCGQQFSRIPNSNTGARIGATRFNSLVNEYKRAFLKKFRMAARPRLASDESWPNWRFYICNSKVIESLWMRNHSKIKEVFKSIFGEDQDFKSLCIYEYKGIQPILFLRLLTLKLWIEQRLKLTGQAESS